MILILFLFFATLFLAYANGANDNFKGVATLFGSRTANYKTAIAWATATTVAGSFASIFLATELIKRFSGKGLVPDAIANSPEFHLAVAAAAGLTVILATRFGFPISTTHGLTGALVGAGFVAIGTKVNFSTLGKSFVLPLLLSPIVAIVLTAIVYSGLHALRQALGIQKESCLCVGEVQPAVVGSVPNYSVPNSSFALSAPESTLSSLDASIGDAADCIEKYQGRVLQVQTQKFVDVFHWLSAGVVSFARGLNDTPKIVALMLIGQSVSIQWSMVAIALAMAIGGWLNARRVAETMSRRITAMNPGQGLSANLVTGFLVILASRYGLPVSTTHVSVGSIFGVGVVSQQANVRVFLQVLLSWVCTLPVAAVLSGGVYQLLQLLN
jgi:inorganic phosphate transporter, PiT family